MHCSHNIIFEFTIIMTLWNEHYFIIQGITQTDPWIFFLGGQTCIIIVYYIDTSVLLENIPLVKFIKTTSGTRLVYFP